MFACVDVDYREDGGAVAACLRFATWDAVAAADTFAVRIDQIEAYQPGAFYRRELPCILAVLARLPEPPDILVIDAYAQLDPQGTPGLGARVHAALGGSMPVVGVAKTRFATATMAIPIRRGTSASPLWITAVGVDPATAAGWIAGMHGQFRVPTLLTAVDRLARTATPI